MSDKRLSSSDVEKRVEEILGKLTVKEKVALMSGKNRWDTVPIDRLGIPSLTMTDGPHGVRTDRGGSDRVLGPATSFPTGVSMAASWDPDLIERVGVALAEETRALGCDILLAPCVNIVRTPLAGRNFETYSEDPYLAGRIGVSYVKGLQSKNVGASVKHYACNNQEIERFRGNSGVDERTLREIYLPAFEAIVKETQPWTVMCAYNRVNGTYASEHDHLLNEILKDEWGFKGAVISDWGANHTTVASAAGGLDVEMPGPAEYYGDLLANAVRLWQIEESVIDDHARRVLRTIVRSGKMDEDSSLPEGAVNTPEHQALARELAEQSMVLLKNEDDLLPMDEDVESIAVIGPNAAEARIGGGGSSYLEPPYRISPLDGLNAAIGDRTRIAHEKGCDNYYELPILTADHLAPVEGEGRGLRAEYFDNASLAGDPVVERVQDQADILWFKVPQRLDEGDFSFRWSGRVMASETGRHTFKLICEGATCELYVNDELVIDTASEGELTAHVDLTAGEAANLRLECTNPGEVDFRIVRVLFAFDPQPEEDTRIDRAVELASRSDVAIVFAGMAKGYESEGKDRPHMDLPGRQDELIQAVAAVNDNTVVVLNCGSPVTMPWIDQVAAVLLAFYPGQEGGNAVANILTGKVNPSGKLPETFPKRYEDNPTYLNYPGTRDVLYGERIFVGYRYYDEKGIDPLFPFGFGLSYTTFEIDDLHVPDSGTLEEPVEVTVTVRNTGERAGQEVVQVYVGDPESTLARPPKELKDFQKVALEPGESKRLSFTLDRRAFSFYDPYREEWVAEPGEFEILVGSSSQDIAARATFVLEE